MIKTEITKKYSYRKLLEDLTGYFHSWLDSNDKPTILSRLAIQYENVKTGHSTHIYEPWVTNHVYIVFNPDNNRFKIGYTSQTPKARLNQLKTGAGSPIRTICSFNWDSNLCATIIEKYLHTAFTDKHSGFGEWFELNENDYGECVKLFKSLEGELNLN